MDKIALQKELNFLVFWAKFDAYTVKRMPTAWRKKHIDWTIENLEILYGKKNDSGPRPISDEEARVK